MDELNSTMQQPTAYNDDDIKTLDWMEHIRRRPGMYIGKLGDGSYADDGIYVLLKEVLDNSIDEYMMGYGLRTRLWPRRSAGQGSRCLQQDEYRSKVR